MRKRQRPILFEYGGQWQYQKRPRFSRLPARRRRRQTVARTRGPFVASESKYFDQEISGFAVGEETQSWAADNDALKGTICIPQEGSDINNRIGRKIAVYKIAVRGVLVNNSATDNADTLANPAVRCVLWIDKQTNGTATNSGALFETGVANTSAVTFCAFQNTANFGRFRVLKDKYYRAPDVSVGTDGANTTSQNSSHIPFKFTYKFKKPLIIKFNATNGGTIGDVVDNSIYLSFQKSGGSFVTNVTARTRCYYKDQ